MKTYIVILYERFESCINSKNVTQFYSERHEYNNYGEALSDGINHQKKGLNYDFEIIIKTTGG